MYEDLLDFDDMGENPIEAEKQQPVAFTSFCLSLDSVSTLYSFFKEH